MSALRINIRFDQEGGLTAKSPLCDLTNPKYHDFRGHYMLLPRTLENHPIWAKDKTSEGHLNRTPYSPTFKPNTISHFQKQYPLTEEKLQGISPLIEEYKKEGILKEIVSPWNTFFIFSVPVGEDAQRIFGFVWGQINWTRLPQEFVDSPAAFSMVLK